MSVLVAGASGLAGSAIVAAFESQGYEVIQVNRVVVDLLDLAATRDFLKTVKPELVVDSAARVGGIGTNNSHPVEFLVDNIRIQNNLMQAAHEADVKRFVFLGSSCIYPRDCAQPIKEEYLMTGPLETTNSAYAIAKIAGIKLCESYNRQYGASHGIDYRSVMPTNLYGPGDNYHPENSHVLPALIRRFHEAKVSGASTVTLWGTGKARREFLYVDDMASASVHVMNLQQDVYAAHTLPMQGHINVGSGSDVTITEVAEMIRDVVGFKGAIDYDTSKPDGAPRKWMDSQKLQGLGWKPSYSLMAGLQKAYADFLQNPSVRNV